MALPHEMSSDNEARQRMSRPQYAGCNQQPRPPRIDEAVPFRNGAGTWGIKNVAAQDSAFMQLPGRNLARGRPPTRYQASFVQPFAVVRDAQVRRAFAR